MNELLAEGLDIRNLEDIKMQILAPVSWENSKLYDIRKTAISCCKARNLPLAGVQILRAETAKFPMVITMAGGIISEKSENLSKTESAVGQDILMIGYAGLAGTLQILDEKEEELKRHFSQVFLSGIRDLREHIFATEEIKAAKAGSVSVMRQVGEGGIYAALYHLAKEAGEGLAVELKEISIRQETIEICEFYRLNPYQLASTGSILVVCNHGEVLADTLKKQGIKASVIGRMTENNDMIIRNGEDIRYIDRPVPDELNKIYAKA
ncbi:MAG: AIR synthase-related protein [Eubacteriales bacterium]|nr:AIR synthase-related protein [Eubacteriales bacterium]